MKYKANLKFLNYITFIFFTASCSNSPAIERLLITVSIPPQGWFVSQIAGDKADVAVLAGQGQNPHNYEAAPRQLQSLSSAGAWILSGTEFEISLLPKITSLFPDLLIVDGTEGIKLRYLSEHDHDAHNEGHSAIEIDRHTWLGREGAKILAAHIKDALSFLDTENEKYYAAAYQSLVRLIDDEFYRLKDDLRFMEGKTVFVYHPSFGYFLDEFGIIQEAVETGGKEPGPRALYELIKNMKEDSPAAVFVQAQFPVNAAKTISDTAGARLISLDPLARDWLENIRSMGQALKGAVR
jgi:zinc transport system substrate-binding protein